jgi:pimeloyl-ACP methyl ester carboxylesterase
MILIGEEDVATPLKHSDNMNNLISNSKLIKIPETGHSSPIENPEFVSEAIEDFIMSQQ